MDPGVAAQVAAPMGVVDILHVKRKLRPYCEMIRYHVDRGVVPKTAELILPRRLSRARRNELISMIRSAIRVNIAWRELGKVLAEETIYMLSTPPYYMIVRPIGRAL